MAPIVETPVPPPVDLGFSVSHQKVELDIDLRSRKLIGYTKITINPHSKDLRVVRLNCRQAAITRLTVNGKPCSFFAYKDPYKNARLQWNAAGVQQYDMLQRKLDGQFKDPPEEELEVTIPKNIKIDELDPFSDEAQTILFSKPSGNNKRDSGDGSAVDLVQNSRTAIEQTARFTPIDLIIQYKIEKVRDGMHFVGWEEGDLRFPHAYTTNGLSPGSACCIFPCVDNLNAKSTWEISIKCQRTIRDALRHPQNSNIEPHQNGAHGVSNSSNGAYEPQKNDVQSYNFSDEDQALDLAVICTGDVTDEVRSCGLCKCPLN